MGKEGMTWEEARRISLLKERGTGYPLMVSDVQEVEILDRSINVLNKSLVDRSQYPLPGEQFVDKMNSKLAVSQVKDVFIYVHGYKVVFENPLLMASELWHFLGYEGVFMPFSWPSTPSTLAYFSDLETAVLSARNLRILIQYLAEETEARRIHIIGYSAGTRVVSRALDQLALMYAGFDCRDSAMRLRIGHVILAGSDIDTEIFGSYLMDGMLDVVEDMTIYASSKDKTLNMSTWLFGRRQRLGQIVNENLSEEGSNYLWQHRKLIIVNASDTPGADSGNGHAYFRQSPLTSSDILAMLMFNLKPKERGLEQTGGLPIWTFPTDYPARLKVFRLVGSGNVLMQVSKRAASLRSEAALFCFNPTFIA